MAKKVNLSLLSGEREIMITEGANVTLTNYRLRYSASSSGATHISSILLEQIAGITYQKKSNPLLLQLGLILIVSAFLVFAAFSDSSGVIAGMAMATMGVLMIIRYYSSIKKGLHIFAGGMAMFIPVNGVQEDNILGFINTIEAAKLKRVEAIYSSKLGSILNV
jgi:hypothetical protein